MKRLLSLCAAVVIAFSATTAFATDLTGTWSGEMPGQNGDTFHISYTFKQDGTKLSGKVKAPQGDWIEISDAKIDGDKFSFNLDVNGTTIHHEGTVSGETIKLATKSDSAEYQGVVVTLTREKSK